MQTATPAADFDARISRIEGIVEQVSQRMASLESRMISLEQGQRDVVAWIRWIVGIQFTTFIALGTLILVKL